MGIEEYYKSLNDKSSKVLDSLFNDRDISNEFTVVHNFTYEIEKLIITINSRPEADIYELSLRELQFSLYAASIGNYRHAHISLRLFLELFLGGIYFSAYEIKLRAWLAGGVDSDLKWSVIAGVESGVFSANFLGVFHPDFVPISKQYQSLISTTYRECSEFVHGNVGTHDFANYPILYNRKLLEDWINRAKSARLCILFAFAGRYIKFVDRRDLDRIEEMLRENLGHIPSVQSIIS